MKVISFRISAHGRSALRRMAKSAGISPGELLRRLIESEAARKRRQQKRAS